MTDEQAKKIAEELRAEYGNGPDMVLASPRDQLLLKLYDDIQAIKASLSGLSFLHAGIQPVRRVDQ